MHSSQDYANLVLVAGAGTFQSFFFKIEYPVQIAEQRNGGV